jgi:hypothetical protein
MALQLKLLRNQRVVVSRTAMLAGVCLLFVCHESAIMGSAVTLMFRHR